MEKKLCNKSSDGSKTSRKQKQVHAGAGQGQGGAVKKNKLEYTTSRPYSTHMYEGRKS